MSKIFDNIETMSEEGLHAILTNVGGAEFDDVAEVDVGDACAYARALAGSSHDAFKLKGVLTFFASRHENHGCESQQKQGVTCGNKSFHNL